MLNLKDEQKPNANNQEKESGHNKNLKTFVSGGKLNLFCLN
jgi:hypothetical protein